MAGLPEGWSDNLLLRTPEEKLKILEKRINKKILEEKIALSEEIAGLPKG